MENLFDESEQNEVASVTEPEFVSKPARSLLSRRNIIIAVVVVAVLVVGYFAKGLLVAATVNGSPISRWSVISKLEKESGKDALDSLITRQLIISELDKNKVTATADEINAEIKKIEDRVVAQGGTLDQALEQQGMSMAELTEQVTINLRIAKLLDAQAQVTDVEITKYIKDNKLQISKGSTLAQLSEQVRETIRSGKSSQAITTWLDTLRAQASIHRWVNY
ncbi:MAG: hypothetical protein A3F25_00205 [Candidatus Yanofskybacteria bacterium RIFCSPHIGHO2_12_FULL_45_19b]|uniref:SurA N-terminal domain-containing protein n=1 Tax=Candidatus Yanofskybacteria bacterium RIFCSPHIGHO2_12_FULL_45_19b TaxID=1802689 RepID=A0A1F8G2L2_9BACT|nr:MAG: hypothetical protein A3F25_00205 [Candidatus Yanofskybacteria bacterium RIFCSPHIGHO2_12_FULL_45_19b]